MKDIKYILKRIIIGTGIALAIFFIRQTVFAYEWTTEGDEQISTVGVGVPFSRYYNSSSGSGTTYPKTISGSSYGSPFNLNSESGYAYNNDTSFNYVHGPYYVIAYKQNLSGITFESGKHYYVIIPLAYKSAMFTNQDTNLNETVVLDSSTYTSNSENIVIDSASFASGVENDIEQNNNYPFYLYFKINFHATADVDDLILYINGDSTSSITYTAFNTTSFDDYLFIFNNQCTSVKSSCYNPVSQRTYKPFVYSHLPESIIPDGNVGLAGVTDDIKNQINNIVNGEFSDDLSFPHVFDGSGLSFGDYTFQDLLLMPLNWLKTIFTNTNTCTGITLPFPGVSNRTFTLPCASTFLTMFLGENLFFIVQLFIACTLGFKILYALFKSAIHIFSPDHFIWVDDIF